MMLLLAGLDELLPHVVLDEINRDWEDDSRVLFCRDSVEGLQIAELEKIEQAMRSGSVPQWPPDARLCSSKAGCHVKNYISFLGWFSDIVIL